MINPDENFITENFNKTVMLLNAVGESKVSNMLGLNNQEYATAPATSRKNYYCSFPGGLCFYNLKVLNNLVKLNSMFGQEDKSTLLKLSVLHNFGKIGSKDKQYFIRMTSDWHQKKGIYYEVNPELSFMKISDRTLLYCNERNIHLTEDEYLAILLSEGQLDETNSHYKHKEPKLATLLQMAVQITRQECRELEVNWP